MDPTGSYLLSPDLGADLIRIYAINRSTGKLTACPSYTAEAGSGPRHAAFWTAPNGSTSVGGGSLRATKQPLTVLYLASELTNSVSALEFSYLTGGYSGCPTLRKIQSLSSYPPSHPAPVPAPQIGEIVVKGNVVYVTNRNDDSFGPGLDSLVTYAIDASTGSLKLQEFQSSTEEWPRTLVVSPKGDLIVVGGQVSSEVAVLKRDVKTGAVGEVLAKVSTGVRGDTYGNGGMSSVIWGE